MNLIEDDNSLKDDLQNQNNTNLYICIKNSMIFITSYI